MPFHYHFCEFHLQEHVHAGEFTKLVVKCQTGNNSELEEESLTQTEKIFFSNGIIQYLTDCSDACNAKENGVTLMQ